MLKTIRIDAMKKLLFATAAVLMLTTLSQAAQKTVTVGTSETPASLDTNFGNIQDNFSELYGWVGQEVKATSNPAFNSINLASGNVAANNVQVVKQWITGLSYTADVTAVVHGGMIYVCQTTHTAGTFATDLAASKWKLWGADIYAPSAVSTVRTTAGGGSTTAPPSEAAVGDALDSIPVITWGTGLTDTSNTISVTYPVTAEAFSGSGWNGDTGGLTRNDAYDYLHQFDSNDDGKVDTIDSGTGPTVDAAGEVAVDTTSDQFAYYGGAKRILSYKRQENFAVKSPVDADDFLLFKAQQAITITDIHVIAQGGTSISVDIQECDSAGANCATVDAAITADTDGAEDDGTLSNGTIDAGDWVKVVLGAPSGTVNFVAGSIYYTITAD